MNILCHLRFYPPGSFCGSDLYMHTLLKWLQKRGHTITVMLGSDAKGCPYEYEGIKVVAKPYLGMPYIVNADLVFTQLDFTAATTEMVKTKPIIWFYHNHSQYGTVRRCWERVTVVYNSEAAQRENIYPTNRSLMLQPPVDIDYYDVSNGTVSDRNITLINLNEAKGGPLFWQLAEAMPEYRFLGVKGSYGVQWLKELPNVEIVENGTDMREVYRRTEILLMPSDYESWGRVATEAAASGIPVISTDTPGLRENMGESGIYLDKRQVKTWIDMIKKLKGKQEYTEQSAKVKKRAQELRPDSKLEIFEEELHKIAKKPYKKREYGNG